MTQTHRIGAQKSEEDEDAKRKAGEGKCECDTKTKCFQIRHVAKLSISGKGGKQMSRWHRKQTRGLQRPQEKRKISNFMKREAYIITFSYHCIRRICIRSPCCRFSLLLLPIVPPNTLPRRCDLVGIPILFQRCFHASFVGLCRELRSTKEYV